MSRRGDCQRLRLGVPATPRLAIANSLASSGCPSADVPFGSLSHAPQIAVPRIIAPPAGERLPA